MKTKTWVRVKAPKVWRASVGEELIGEYLGSEPRTGQFGEYRVHLVKSKGRVHYASGVALNDLFSVVKPHAIVKLVFLGVKVSDSGNEYKLYDLFTETQ